MIKSIECNPNGCGTFFTIEAKLNSISHEHLQFCIEKGYEYKEAIIEKIDNITIIKCPKCQKEAVRIWH